MSQSWAVVCTLKEPRSVVERFVAHHLALGCTELFLFFSDPEDPAIPWARAQPGVRVEPIEEQLETLPDGRILRRSRFGEYVTIDEKLLISAAHAHAWSASDWIVHLDGDEHLWCPEGVSAYLGSLPSDVWMVTVAPVEAVYERFEDSRTDFNTHLFRRALPFGEASDALVAELYGELAGMFRHGLLGHTAGKSFLRRTPDLLEVGIHYGRHRDPEAPTLYERDRMKLVHFDALSFDRWRRKLGMRVSGDFLSYATGPHRLRQRAMFEERMNDEAGLEAVFRDLLVLEGERLAFAEAHGMVERLELGPRRNG
jgi:hypothetical protein